MTDESFNDLDAWIKEETKRRLMQCWAELFPRMSRAAALGAPLLLETLHARPKAGTAERLVWERTCDRCLKEAVVNQGDAVQWHKTFNHRMLPIPLVIVGICCKSCMVNFGRSETEVVEAASSVSVQDPWRVLREVFTPEQFLAVMGETLEDAERAALDNAGRGQR